MNNQGLVLQKDELNESWVDVDVHYKNASSENSSNGAGSPKNDNFQQSGLYTPLNIEKLLQDAQRESEQNSRETSTRTSPKIRTPTEGEVTQELSTDWIWDWSSGPEMVQPSQAMKFTKAAKKRPGYTLRNTSVMRTSIFCKENVTALVASHVSVFILGALVTYMILKKSGGQQVASQS